MANTPLIIKSSMFLVFICEAEKAFELFKNNFVDFENYGEYIE